MKNNLIQFAVVREDPQIEMDIISNFGLTEATLIGSGGCTAFCLKAMDPMIKITLIEPNPAQVNLINEKIRLLKSEESAVLLNKFGVENASPASLSGCGNFESLFRSLRFFIQEFIISEAEMEAAFSNSSTDIWKEVFQHRYWKVAFDLYFSDSILTAMFGPAAIQHAPRGSYPIYFQRVFEKGLCRNDAPENYFLHHIFLGRYLNDEKALPYYLVNLPQNLEFNIFQGAAQNYDGFKDRQLAHFSNIFDWCDESEVREIARLAAQNLSKGSVLVYRQLNNKKDFRPFFGKNFRWLETKDIVESDRSLFYEKIEIGEKIL